EQLALTLVASADVAAQRGDMQGRARLADRVSELVLANELDASAMWDAVVLTGQVLLEQGRSEGGGSRLEEWLRALGTSIQAQAGVADGLSILLQAAGMIENQAMVDQVARMIVEVDSEQLSQRLAGVSEEVARHVYEPFRIRTELVLGYCLPLAGSGVAPLW